MLGIMQGRLSYSGKKLQNFPSSPYKEFKIASSIGYDFIEFFSENTKNAKNPIWSDSGINNYIKFSKINKIKIFSLCDNYIINHSLSSKNTFNTIIHTLSQLNKLRIKKYILPLYGRSEINFKKKNIKKIFKNLSIIAKICLRYNIELIFESNMSPNEFEKFKKNINSKNCFFLFDTGNRINLNYANLSVVY